MSLDPAAISLSDHSSGLVWSWAITEDKGFIGRVCIKNVIIIIIHASCIVVINIIIITSNQQSTVQCHILTPNYCLEHNAPCIVIVNIVRPGGKIPKDLETFVFFQVIRQEVQIADKTPP